VIWRGPGVEKWRAEKEDVMTKVRVAGFSLSLDGFGAGPEQNIDDPLGKRGMELHRWSFGTKTFRAMHGEGGGSEGVDEAFARRSMEGFGAFILGRNMFGPVRGEWPDDSWKGWWGDNPPYHAPVFVLTHHARASVEMAGGTIFHFVTHGIEAALEQAIIGCSHMTMPSNFIIELRLLRSISIELVQDPENGDASTSSVADP
jgi:dihydrofolate reductase